MNLMVSERIKEERFRHPLSFDYRTLQCTPVAFQNFSTSIGISGRWYWIRSFEISGRDAIWFIEFPTPDREAILKGEALRRSANERVDRIPLSEGKSFLNLTWSSASCVLTRIHCELPFWCRYTGSSSFDLSLSSAPFPYLVPFIPSSLTTVSWIYCRALSLNQETQRGGSKLQGAPRTFQDLPVGLQDIYGGPNDLPYSIGIGERK